MITLTHSNQSNHCDKYLLEYYKEDIWDLRKHETYSSLTERQNKRISDSTVFINFGLCMNKNIKNELKYFCQDMITKQGVGIQTFSNYIAGLKRVMEYINMLYPDEESIVIKGFGEMVKEYGDFLTSKGHKTHLTVHNQISEDMEYLIHNPPTIHFRMFINLYKFIDSEFNLVETSKNIFVQDYWDIRDLPFEIKGFDMSRPRYKISFTNINQAKLKILVKKFVYEKLKTNKYSTVMDIMKGINYLSEFLEKKHPLIDSATDIDRKIIEDFMGYVNTSDKLATRAKSSRIGSVKTFLETAMLFGWDDSPTKTLFVTDDVKKKKKIAPKFYEDNVIELINKHIENLPVQIARMYYVLQNVGMRIGELCTLKTDCLQRDTENDYVLVYIQHKTNSMNRVPIKENIAIAIQEAIKDGEDAFGENVVYVFSQDWQKPISVEAFSYHMNQMIKKCDIRDFKGDLVRIKAHTFRGTVATKYANLGMSPNVIRILLGQRSLGAIKHYIEIVEDTLMNSMKDIIQFQEQMIQNIGKKNIVIRQGEEDKELIPLPNGSCSKPISSGKCLHANACYTCAMFVPDPNDISLFKHQLTEAKSSVEMAKISGFERIKQINEDLADALEKIILSIEKGCA